MKIKLQVISSLIWIGVIVSSAIGFTDSLDTSIVALVVSGPKCVIQNEPYFELVDMGDYVLLPINALSSILELNFNFDREQDIVTINSFRFQRQAEIHFDDQTYRIGEKLEWRSQPPLALNGDFYVCSMLIEFVAQVKISWNAQNQELIIFGDWFPEPTANHPTPSKFSNTPDDEPGVMPLEGPDFSVGAIEYKLTMENLLDSDGTQSITNILGLRGDGRAGPWSVSLGADFGYDFFSEPRAPSWTLIRAKYNLNHQIIILGDSEVYLEETLGLKDIRGILYLFPENQINQNLYVWTKVSGAANPGDKVQLFVNNLLMNEVTVREGDSYLFANVSLKPRRVNIIRVIIEKPSGERMETTKKILASPGLIERDTNQYLLAAGSYHQSGLKTSEGDFIALRVNNGLTDWASLNCEMTAFKPTIYYQPEQPVIYGADVGVEMQITPSLIYSLDWLLAGSEDEASNQSGWKSSILYCANRGCFEVTGFNTPAEINKGLRNITPGRGVILNHELEGGQNMDFKVSGSLVETLLGTLSKLTKTYNIYLGYHSNPQAGLQSVTSAKLTHQIIDSPSEGVSSTVKQTGLILEYTANTKGFSTKNQLELVNIDTNGISSPLNLKSVGLKSNFIKSINDSLLLGLTINPRENWNNGNITDINLNVQTNLKWNTQNFGLLMNYLVEQEMDPSLDSGLIPMKEEYNWSIKYYFNRLTNLSLNGASKNDNNGYSYTKNDLGFSWSLPQAESRLWLDLGYISPLGADIWPQWTYSLGFQKVFNKSGLQLSLETEKLFDSTNNSFQGTTRLILSQAIGFGSSRVQTMKYSTLENLSFISGIVYLDENGNGQRDPGEKGIPGIKIALEGKIAQTNESGVYIFHQVDPGIYRLNFSLNSLPADYTPNTPEQLIMVKQSENQFVDFGVTINGSISGKVYLDLNANGKQDEDEEALSWIGVQLDSNKKTFTSQNGTFYFENIPLGPHTISIIPETVPATMQVPGQVYHVLITEQNLDSQAIIIPIVYKFLE